MSALFARGMFGFQSTGGSEYQLTMSDTDYTEWNENDSEQPPFQCPYPDCGHSFKYKGNLNVHQRNKHGGLYGSDQLVTFFCRVLNCGRSFYSRGALAKHQRCIHHM